MTRPLTIFDTEVYRDYFLASFLDLATGQVTEVEATAEQPLNLEALKACMRKRTLVGFNSGTFDLPVLAVALEGADCERIHKAAGAIIRHNYRSWQFEQAWNVRLPKIDHIDLIEVAPGIASLKLYAGRLHAQRMQDLPIDPDASISPDQRAVLRQYCRNDLANTAALYRALEPQIELRSAMSAEYDIDLRSKSDAQIAEAVLVHQVKVLRKSEIVRPEIEPGTVYHYRAPAWLQFRSLALTDVLTEIEASDFVVSETGNIKEPLVLQTGSVPIGNSRYRLGIGGLHSSETCQSVEADDEHVLIDRDVASYYPSIILRLGLAPAQMGTEFLRAYRSIVDRRLAAKAAGDKVLADTLKIVVNGSFGKLGSRYSRLYSPDLLIQVTVTGQLCLLMLIDELEAEGISVVSANTDGIVIRCHHVDTGAMASVIKRWEQRTGFVTEETRYRALYSRDVNNYIAVKADGGVKLKGAYALAGLAKNPANLVAIDAAVQWLRTGVPIEDTIRTCQDVRRFVTVRTVAGGAIDQQGRYLGKAIRWYYARGVDGPLRYQKNGYTVPRTHGARPLMELPDQLPRDVDYRWYEREAISILTDVGAVGGLL